MQKLLFVFLLLFSYQIGAMEFVKPFASVQELIDNKDGALVAIKEAMDEFSKKIQILAQEKGLNSATENMAWMLTMYVIINGAYIAAGTAIGHASCVAVHNARCNIACDAARRAACNAAYDAACNAACNAARDTAFNYQSSNAKFHIGAHNAAHEAARNAAYYVASNVATCDLNKQGEIICRIAELAALSYFLENFEAIFQANYDAALAQLAIIPPKDLPFENLEALTLFNEKFFAKLSYESMVLLAPWLIHLMPMSLVARDHRSLFVHHHVLLPMLDWSVLKEFILACDDEKSILFNLLPRDLIDIIAFTVVKLRKFKQTAR